MNHRSPGSRSGFVLPFVLIILALLVLTGFILLTSSQEGYNQVAAAVAGRRADVLARAAADEALRNLTGWLGRLPGRCPPKGEELVEAIVARIRQQVPDDPARIDVISGNVWNEDLRTFFPAFSRGAQNLIAATQADARSEGFVIDSATVRLHGFCKINTRFNGDPQTIDYYRYQGASASSTGSTGSDDTPEPAPAPVIDWAGFATFTVALRNSFARMPVERTFSATYDIRIVDTAPIAKQFAVFQYHEVPRATDFLNAFQAQAHKVDTESFVEVGTDLNRGGGLRVFSNGGRAFVNGPYVVESTGWPNGTAPDVVCNPAALDFGPGLPTDYHWAASSFVGFGGVPAPRAGIMDSVSLLPMIGGWSAKNARPRRRAWVWIPVLENLQAISDPGVKLGRPQYWHGEFADREPGGGREDRNFSLFGDPRQEGGFRPYKGVLVRLNDKGETSPKRWGLVAPSPSIAPPPAYAYQHPAMQKEYESLEPQFTTIFSGSVLDYLTKYDGRRFAVLPEGRLFMLARYGEFRTPPIILIIKALLNTIFAIATAYTGALEFLIPQLLSQFAFDGYQMGHDCEGPTPVSPDTSDNPGPIEKFIRTVDAAVRNIADFAKVQTCLLGIENDKTALPDKVLHMYGAHWQPYVYNDAREDFFQALLTGALLLVSVGVCGGLGGTSCWQAVLTGTTLFTTGSLIMGSCVTPEGVVSAVVNNETNQAVRAPGLRNLMLASMRRYETLEDALQTVPGKPDKLLVLSGPMYVRRLVNTSPFHYCGHGIIYTDHAFPNERPLLTGPIVPLGYGTTGGPISPADSSLTVIAWPDAGVSAINGETLMVRLSGADPALGDLTAESGTTAVFKLSLVAHAGASPDPGKDGGRKTTLAIIRGNYVCGLFNKRFIPPDSALWVRYDPALAQVDTRRVGVVAQRPIADHR